MRIGLVDVDGHNFPNLALMKISAWHKAQGDSVEFAIPLLRYDRIYKSKVFTFTPDDFTAWMCDDVRKGGTGYDLTSKLPNEVEHTCPDYSLYGITNTAYGYLSRGCPRGCPFCIVADKEGRASRKVADLREWWSGQKEIKLLDPNLTACTDWRDLFVQLADSGASVDFTQGLDIRLLTDEKIAALNSVKISNIHFAWDNANDDLRQHFERYATQAKRKYHAAFATVYVLTNFNSTMEQNLYRINTLRDLGYDPYVMVYDKQHAPKEVKRLQRWCNNRVIFKSTKWEDYNG